MNGALSVRGAAIDAIDGQRVMIIHVCDERSLVADDSYGSLFIDGTVNTLRLPIARNDTLMSALDEEGLDQNDVVSLRLAAAIAWSSTSTTASSAKWPLKSLPPR